MTEILNVDNLADVQRVMMINGVKHTMGTLSVGDFIYIRKSMREAQKYGEDEVDLALEIFLEVILRMWPTINREELMAVPVEQFERILQFTQGNLDKEEDAAPDNVKN